MITPVQFYQIVSQNSGLSLRPQDPNAVFSQLVQDHPGTPVRPEFQWGFIEERPERYRIFNRHSGFSVESSGNTPYQDEPVTQDTWKAGQADQEWYFDGILFISAIDEQFVWQVKGFSTQPGEVVVLHTKTGERNQEFTLIPVSTALVEAAAT